VDLVLRWCVWRQFKNANLCPGGMASLLDDPPEVAGRRSPPSAIPERVSVITARWRPATAAEMRVLEAASCGICFTVLSDPETHPSARPSGMLRCGHTWCRPCLQELRGECGIAVTCPSCRTDTPVPLGLASVPRNHALEAIAWSVLVGHLVELTRLVAATRDGAPMAVDWTAGDCSGDTVPLRPGRVVPASMPWSALLQCPTAADERIDRGSAGVGAPVASRAPPPPRYLVCDDVGGDRDEGDDYDDSDDDWEREEEEKGFASSRWFECD